jgi:hypothetical protein
MRLIAGKLFSGIVEFQYLVLAREFSGLLRSAAILLENDFNYSEIIDSCKVMSFESNPVTDAGKSTSIIQSPAVELTLMPLNLQWAKTSRVF